MDPQITKLNFKRSSGRFLANMGSIRRNPATYRFCTPWHADYAIHRRFQAEPGFESLRAYLQLLKDPIDPSVSDSRLDHLKTLDGSLNELADDAARIRGAVRAWPSLHGCTGANHLALEATVRSGDKILLTAGCHRSMEDWIYLKSRQSFDLKLVNISTTWSKISETYLPPTTEEVTRVVREHPDTRLVVITCPTYPGLYPRDLSWTIQTIRHFAPEAKVLIDGAWATHFGISPIVPEFPLRSGADLVTSSDHKTGLAEEQAAMLYLGSKDAKLAKQIDIAFQALSTTSPNHRILASLEASILTLEKGGESLIRNAVEFADCFKQAIKQINGLRVMEPADLGADPLRFVQDPLKIFLDTSGLGFSGRRMYQLLEQQERVIAEMATEQGVLFLFNPAYKPEDAWDCAERLLGVLTVNEPEENNYEAAPPPVPRMVVSPARAFAQADGCLPLHKAIGRIAAGAVGVYPPGIYVLRPGQLIDEPTIEYLEKTLARKTRPAVQGLVCNEVPVVSPVGCVTKSMTFHSTPMEVSKK